ncbi:MAG: hypothetical protein SFY67_12400 [Candidatus Melainabacteria bacterium]|nr:hypothetical protein [Candidatus Melainabacteria bacterium]
MRNCFQLLFLLCVCLQSAALADDGDSAAEAAAEKAVQKTVEQAEKKMASQQYDFMLYQQMQQVANYMSQYCIQNKRWPEPGDQTQYVVKQLNELVPNNPYKPNDLQESQFFSTDSSYHYDDPTKDDFIPGAQSGAAGSADNVMPDTQLGTSTDLRVQLQFNPSLSAQMVKDWQTEAPLEWQAAPGSITAISNSQDLFVIWGSGANGKPIKSPNGTTRLYIGNVNMYADDMSDY